MADNHRHKASTSLRHLEFYDCIGLINLPCEMLQLCAPSLERLVLTGSKSLTNLPQVMSFPHNMPRLTTLEIKDVPILTDDVAMESGYLGSLENLYIGCSSECQDYVSFLVSLDLIFPALLSLHELRLYGLEDWDTPESTSASHFSSFSIFAWLWNRRIA